MISRSHLNFVLAFFRYNIFFISFLIPDSHHSEPFFDSQVSMQNKNERMNYDLNFIIRWKFFLRFLSWAQELENWLSVFGVRLCVGCSMLLWKFPSQSFDFFIRYVRLLWLVFAIIVVIFDDEVKELFLVSFILYQVNSWLLGVASQMSWVSISTDLV